MARPFSLVTVPDSLSVHDVESLPDVLIAGRPAPVLAALLNEAPTPAPTRKWGLALSTTVRVDVIEDRLPPVGTWVNDLSLDADDPRRPLARDIPYLIHKDIETLLSVFIWEPISKIEHRVSSTLDSYQHYLIANHAVQDFSYSVKTSPRSFKVVIYVQFTIHGETYCRDFTILLE